MSRNRFKNITTEKIILNSKPKRIVGLTNTKTFVPYVGMINKQTEFSILK